MIPSGPDVGCWHLTDIPACAGECPLLGVKRTWGFESVMSVFDPKREWATFES
jgi:hypothetical protein